MFTRGGDSGRTVVCVISVGDATAKKARKTILCHRPSSSGHPPLLLRAYVTSGRSVGPFKHSLLLLQTAISFSKCQLSFSLLLMHQEIKFRPKKRSSNESVGRTDGLTLRAIAAPSVRLVEYVRHEPLASCHCCISLSRKRREGDEKGGPLLKRSHSSPSSATYV